MGKLVLGLVQVLPDKAVTTLKSIALVAYPVHFLLLNSSATYLWWFVEDGLTLVTFCKRT